MLHLIINNEGIGKKTFPLDSTKTYAIGRFSGDITLEFEPDCSPRHATLKFDGVNWKLVDEMSEKGTHVDGREVNFAEMSAGVIASIGETKLEVADPNAADVPSTPAQDSSSGAEPVAAPAPEGMKQASAPKVNKANVARKVSQSVAPAKTSIRTSGEPEIKIPVKEQGAKTLGASVAERAADRPKNRGRNFAIIAMILVGVAAFGYVLSNSGGEFKPKVADDPGLSASNNPNKLSRSGEAAQMLADAKRIEGNVQAKFEALKAIQDRYSADLGEIANNEVKVLLREVQEEFNGEVKSALNKFLINADRHYPTKNGAAPDTHKLHKAMAELTAFDEELAKIKEVNPAFYERAIALELPEKVRELRKQYVSDSERYLGQVKALAIGFELSAQFQEAAKLLRYAAECVIISKEDKAILLNRSDALAVRKLATLSEWVYEVSKVRRTKSSTAAKKKTGTAPKGEKKDPAEVKKDEPKDPDTGEEKPVVVKKEPSKRKLPELKYFPTTQELEATTLNALREVIRLSVESEGYEPKSFVIERKRVRLLAVDEGGVTIHKSGAEIAIAWTELDPEILAEIVKTLKLNHGPTLVALAVSACASKDWEIAGETLARVIKETPELTQEAHIYFAFKQDRDMPPEGLVVYKRTLMFPSDKTNFERLDRVGKALKELKSNLRGTSKTALKNRKPLLEELLTLGDEAVKPTIALLIEAREDALERAKKTTGTAKNTKVLDELKKELNTRRKHALSLIEDTVKWPYPYGPNNAEVTAEVMKRVAAVRAIWVNPASFKGKSSKKAEGYFDLIRLVSEYLDRFDPNGEAHSNDLEKDLDYLNAISNTALNIQNHAIDGNERSFITKAQEILKENADIAKKFEGDAKAPDAEAWIQLKVTNDYRLMMGRQALKMNFKLYWAAKHHSAWCITSNGGKITHDSPGGPRGNNVPQRCGHEGYSRGTGENIHMDGRSPTPQSAHNSWLSSSGHHRNILSARWTVMGNGRSKTIWTQNFGNGDEGTGNQESKGGA